MKGQRVRFFADMPGNMTGETECQIQMSAKTVEVTDKDDTDDWDVYEVVSKSISLSASGIYASSNSSFYNWLAGAVSRSSVEKFGVEFLDDGFVIYGDFVISDFKVTAQVGDVVKATITVQSTGTPEITFPEEMAAEYASFSLRADQSENKEFTPEEETSANGSPDSSELVE